MPRVFISYRRIDSEDATARIYDYLVTQLGKRNIFKDVDAIPPGEDFVERIRSEIRKCDVVLVVIGQQWSQIEDESGNRRLTNPRDVVRLEIELALAEQKRLVPVLVHGAAMPRETELPESLKPIRRQNAALVRHGRDFPFDMKGLYNAIAPGHAIQRSLRIIVTVLIVIGTLSAGTYHYVSSSAVSTGESSNGKTIDEPAMIAQVRISSPAYVEITLQSKDGTFPTSPQYLAPALLSLQTATKHRLKLGRIPGFADRELYPSLEFPPTTSLTQGFLSNNPIVIEFTEEEFLMVASGKEVTKVFFLPDPEFQELYAIGIEPPTPVMASYELDPGIDVILEADRRGTVLAILRLGAIDMEVPMGAPTP